MGEDILAVLQKRGFVAQTTDAPALSARLAEGPQTLYTGYDPTADSLHVGHLLTLMGLAHLERAGHRPLVLLGGGTAMVGDPSGKTQTRQLLQREQIEANSRAMESQISRFLRVGQNTHVLNNASWLLELSYIEFLRDIGSHFSVNRMLQAEAYKQRLQRGLSFIEFNYQLLQSYDFLQLSRSHGCVLQFGGDDQWGNILAGVDLCRRLDQKLVFGMTCPLLTNASGEKMGKTQRGALWLDPKKVPPSEYYQYWVNVDDADVTRLLNLFTFLPTDEIMRLERLSGADLNAAKNILAFEATSIAHGTEAGHAAHAAAMASFGRGGLSETVLPTSLIPREAGGDAAAMPTTTLTEAALEAHALLLVDLLLQIGLAPSKNEARRLLTQGAVRFGALRPQDPLFLVTPAHFKEGPIIIRVGKKRAHRLIYGQA